MTTGWLRYRDQLAHTVSSPQSINETNTGEATGWRPEERSIGVSWRSTCNRELRIYFDSRPSSAEWVDPIALRAERPRGFCLTCLYFAALDALVLEVRGYRAFIDLVEAGCLPGIDASPTPPLTSAGPEAATRGARDP